MCVCVCGVGWGSWGCGQGLKPHSGFFFFCHVFSFPVNQRSMAGELSFPSAEECDSSVTPTRHVTIPVTFLDVLQYRQVLKSALRGRCFTLCKLK